MKKKMLLLLVAVLLGMGGTAKKQTAAPVSFAHPWTSKRVAYIGDSVSDPNVKQTDGMKHYWDFLAEWLSTTPLVYATNGHTLKNGLSNVDRLHAERGDSVDVIVVFLGTNDFNAGLPLGELYVQEETEVERATGTPRHKEFALRRTPVLRDNTICGRINLIIHKIKTLYPEKQLVMLTPLHRGFAEFGERNVQPDESYSNARGTFIGDVARAITEAGRIWSVPIIDLYALSGLSPTLPEYSKYFFNAERDCLHPNERGHERIARTILQQSLTLPAF